MSSATSRAIEKAMAKRRSSAATSAPAAAASASPKTPQEIALAKVKRGATASSASSGTTVASAQKPKPKALIKSSSGKSARSLSPVPSPRSPAVVAVPSAVTPPAAPSAASQSKKTPRRSLSPAAVHQRPASPVVPEPRRILLVHQPKFSRKRYIVAFFCAILFAFIGFLLSSRINPEAIALPAATQSLAIKNVASSAIEAAQRDAVRSMAEHVGITDGTVEQLVALYNSKVETMHRMWVAIGGLAGFTAGLLLG